MLLSVWSNSAVRAGVTSVAAAVGVLLSARYGEKVWLVENHPPYRTGLEKVLIEDPVRTRAGIVAEQVPWQRKESFSPFTMVKNGAGFFFRIPTRNGGLFLRERENCFGSIDGFEIGFADILQQGLMRKLKELPGTVLFDLKGADSLTSGDILEQSDLVLVLLPPDRYAIQEYFEIWHQHLQDRCILVADAQPISFVSTIREQVGESARMVRIPRDDRFARILKNGELVPFLEENYWNMTRDAHYDLMCSLRKLCAWIYREEQVCQETRGIH